MQKLFHDIKDSPFIRQGFINLLQIYGRRFLRIFPIFITIVIYLLTIEQNMSNGPAWKSITISTKENCRKNFWKKIFLFQNKMEMVCIVFN